MNSVHDMGGMDGFGKVKPEPNEPMFHAEWEGRVLAMVRAMGAAGAFNIDASRFYREALPPHVYLTSSYYRKWLLGLEDLLIDKGYIAAAEVVSGHASNRQSRSSTASSRLPMSSASWSGANSGAPRRRRRSSSRAIGCVQRTFIRQRTPGCRATRAAISA